MVYRSMFPVSVKMEIALVSKVTMAVIKAICRLFIAIIFPIALII